MSAWVEARTRTHRGVGPSKGMSMNEDEEQIRTLIEQWADAARNGDLDGVLAHHSATS